MQQTSMVLAALVAMAAVGSTAGSSLLRKTAVVPKQEPIINNPADCVPVGDVVPDAEPPQPKGQQYDHMYAPVSPKSAQDFSPSDPSEYLAGWQGAAADALDHISASEGRLFEGSTCESVCSACSIYAAQQDGGMCFCYATCKMGECGAGSGVMPHIGWSNNEVSTPRTMWEAKCSVGTKSFEAQCESDQFKKDLKECEDHKGNPTECFRRLSQLNQPLPMDARKQVHYCALKGMKSCDTFMNAPTEGGWMCYNYAEKCKEKVATGFRIPMQSWEAPSVWETVR